MAKTGIATYTPLDRTLKYFQNCVCNFKENRKINLPMAHCSSLQSMFACNFSEMESNFPITF